MKLKALIISAVSIVLLSQTACADSNKPTGLKEGIDYKVIQGANQSKKPQIVEVFSYHCGHCYNMEDFVEKWIETKPANIEFKQVPLYIPSAEHLAKAYYVAELLNVVDKTHMTIFHTWHRDGKILRSVDDLIPIFEQAGISKEKFMSAYNSFAVDSKVQYAKKIMKDYQITAVPTFVVNNKYEIQKNDNFLNYKLLNEFPLEKSEK